MTSRDFAYWLQGYFEINGVTSLTKEQAQMIQKHLNMVFIHEIDPSMGGSEHQEQLNAIHDNSIHDTVPAEFHNKPVGWDSTWEYSKFHGWYDPKVGRPRC